MCPVHTMHIYMYKIRTNKLEKKAEQKTTHKHTKKIAENHLYYCLLLNDAFLCWAYLLFICLSSTATTAIETISESYKNKTKWYFTAKLKNHSWYCFKDVRVCMRACVRTSVCLKQNVYFRKLAWWIWCEMFKGIW